jgi:hypothetical protein
MLPLQLLLLLLLLTMMLLWMTSQQETSSRAAAAAGSAAAVGTGGWLVPQLLLRVTTPHCLAAAAPAACMGCCCCCCAVQVLPAFAMCHWYAAAAQASQYGLSVLLRVTPRALVSLVAAHSLLHEAFPTAVVAAYHAGQYTGCCLQMQLQRLASLQ